MSSGSLESLDLIDCPICGKKLIHVNQSESIRCPECNYTEYIPVGYGLIHMQHPEGPLLRILYEAKPDERPRLWTHPDTGQKIAIPGVVHHYWRAGKWVKG